jgi:hypothetical protein
MKASLQYLPTNGHAELLTRLRDMQEKVHGLAKDFWNKNDVIVTNGSQVSPPRLTIARSNFACVALKVYGNYSAVIVCMLL